MSSNADERLRETVATTLPAADPETISIVAACAGLLAGVAYADRELSDVEVREVSRLLASVHGIDEAGATAITQAVRADILELATVHRARFCRTLEELGSHDLRLHVLGLLVQLAAADDDLNQGEVTTLRQTTVALGLTQDDYNRLQAEHREKLSSLR